MLGVLPFPPLVLLSRKKGELPEWEALRCPVLTVPDEDEEEELAKAALEGRPLTNTAPPRVVEDGYAPGPVFGAGEDGFVTPPRRPSKVPGITPSRPRKRKLSLEPQALERALPPAPMFAGKPQEYHIEDSPEVPGPLGAAMAQAPASTLVPHKGPASALSSLTEQMSRGSPP